jgi:hypothetical protein
MQDMVDTRIAAPLHCVDVGRFFHNADKALVAGGACAIQARIDIGDVVADGAESKAGLEPANSFRQSRSVIVA